MRTVTATQNVSEGSVVCLSLSVSERVLWCVCHSTATQNVSERVLGCDSRVSVTPPPPSV